MLRTLGEELREKVQEGHAEEARLREKGIEKDEAVGPAVRSASNQIAGSQTSRDQKDESCHRHGGKFKC